MKIIKTALTNKKEMTEKKSESKPEGIKKQKEDNKEKRMNKRWKRKLDIVRATERDEKVGAAKEAQK
jgi:HKD family nuclease